MKLAPPATHGVVNRDGIYTLAAVADRLGVGEAWLRTARGKGLPVRRIGRRAFVLGSELHEFLKGLEAHHGPDDHEVHDVA
jgi:hypothetical protein